MSLSINDQEINILRDFTEVSKAQKRGSSTHQLYKDKQNKEWIIKNPNSAKDYHWVLHEFVSSKLYSHFLGTDLTAEIKLIYDQKKKKALIAIEKLDNFIKFDPTTQKQNKNVNPFPWNCIKSRCQIDENGKVKILQNDIASKYLNKPIVGFEIANLISNFVNDGDINSGNNFMLINKPNEYVVSRFDYDDSLKFFDQFDIAKGFKHRDINTGQLSPYFGVSAEAYFYMNEDAFRKSNKYDIVQIKRAINKFTQTNWSGIKTIIDEAFIEVSKYFTEEDVKTWYDIEKLDCFKYPHHTAVFEQILTPTSDLNKHCHYNKYDSNLDKVKTAIKYFLSRRYEDILDMETCLVVEEAIISNNVSEAEKITKERDLKKDDLICASSFFNPTQSSPALAMVSHNQYVKMTYNQHKYYKSQGMKIFDGENMRLKNLKFENAPHNEAYQVFENYFAQNDEPYESLVGRHDEL